MPTRFPLATLAAATALLAASCSSSSPLAPEATAPTEPVTRVDWSALAWDGAVMGVSALARPLAELTPATRSVRLLALNAPANGTLIQVDGPDSVRLALFRSAAGALQVLDTRTGNVTYTAAWRPDLGRLAFAYRGGAGSGVATTTADERESTNVGCSASDRVFALRDDGDLVVGDGSNIYLVEADGCKTLATFSLRKRHLETVNAPGTHVAYVFRDLLYNRPQRKYEPDSTLFVRALGSEEETKILGDRYRVRNLAWSPDGKKLAFDAAAAEGSTQERQVAYYDLETGESVFVLPPEDQTAPVDQSPSWSPSGDAIAFERLDPERGTHQILARAFVDRLTRVVVSEPIDRGTRVVQWVGDEALLLRGADGTHRLMGLDGKELRSFPSDLTPLFIWKTVTREP